MIVTSWPPECNDTCNAMSFTKTEAGAICLVCGHEFPAQKPIDGRDLAWAIAAMQQKEAL